MGRHRKYPTDENGVKKRTAFTDTESVDERVEERLGHTKQVCSDCNARNPSNADTCRKCGSSSLREKASEYRDG